MDGKGKKDLFARHPLHVTDQVGNFKRVWINAKRKKIYQVRRWIVPPTMSASTINGGKSSWQTTVPDTFMIFLTMYSPAFFALLCRKITKRDLYLRIGIRIENSRKDMSLECNSGSDIWPTVFLLNLSVTARSCHSEFKTVFSKLGVNIKSYSLRT